MQASILIVSLNTMGMSPAEIIILHRFEIFYTTPNVKSAREQLCVGIMYTPHYVVVTKLTGKKCKKRTF